MIDTFDELATDLYYLPSTRLSKNWQQSDFPDDWMIFHVDGSLITNEDECLQALSQSLQSPDYCTNNFDAMLNCLRLIPVLKSGAYRYIIVYTESDSFRSNDPQGFEIALKVFDAAVLTWRKTRHELRLSIVLVSENDDWPDFVQKL